MNRTSMMFRSAVVFVALAVLSSPGCFWSPELSRVRRDIARQIPHASFDRNIELSFGPVLLSLARMVTAMIPDARGARPYLSGVSRVEVGIYQAHVDSTAGLHMPAHLQSLIEHGWETAVRARDGHEAVWLLYHPDGDHVKEIFVVILDNDELVLVKAGGHIEKLVAAVLEEMHGKNGLPDAGS